MRSPRTQTRWRIGIYDPSRSPSGPSRYVDSLLRGLDPDEFEVVIFGHPGGPFGSRPGLPVEDTEGAGAGPAEADGDNPMRGGRPLGALARHGWRRLAPTLVKHWGGFGRECVRLSRIFRRRPVDLLHTNNTGCEESPVAARMAGISRVIGTFHVDSSYDLARTRSGPGHRALERLSNHCLHRAIAVSEATKDDWVRRTGLPTERVDTIHNGVDPEAFRRRIAPAEARARLGLPGGGKLLVGGVGRLHEAKGFADVIEAVALLAGDYPDLALAIAGDGPLRISLAERASALGVADRVHFLGFHRDVRPVFEALDVFVLSSLCEALGYVLLEAMAMGLPAVGTRVGGVPEVIAPGETGFLVQPRDPRALASILQLLLSSDEIRRRMGAAGRELVVRNFDERQTVRRTIEVYRCALKNNYKN